MGYLNYNLEKVASAVEGGMEKKASKFLATLGNTGRGVGRAIRGAGRSISNGMAYGVDNALSRVNNHIFTHMGKYMLGVPAAGLAGLGIYNYANTRK